MYTCTSYFHLSFSTMRDEARSCSSSGRNVVQSTVLYEQAYAISASFVIPSFASSHYDHPDLPSWGAIA